MQVYRDLRILTARPGAEEEARVPHILFGHVDGAINYSVGRYVEDAAAALAQTQAEGQLPIFVGGTGLYFKALTQGISDMPRVPEAVRVEWRTRAGTMPVGALHAELAARDPLMAARLKPSDPQRILRALEVHAATGQSLAVFQAAKGKPLLDFETCRAIFLAPERAALRAAIDRRFEAMLEKGALEEVAALRERRLDPALPVMRALGVPQLLRHLAGACEISLPAAEQAPQARHARLCQAAVYVRAASITALSMGESGRGRSGAGRIALRKNTPGDRRAREKRGSSRRKRALRRDGPGDIERRIVPRKAEIMPAGIIGRHFVEHFAIGFERTEAMRETSQKPELRPILRAQNCRDKFAIARRAAPDIDGHVEHRAAQNAHELALLGRRRLEMQSTDRPNLRR